MEKTCISCHKTESDANQLFTCNYCFVREHVKCRRKTGKIIKSDDNMQFCSVKCSSLYERVTASRIKNELNISQLIDEIKSVMHANARTVTEQVKSVTSAIEASQEFLSSKFESILVDFKVLKEENTRLKQELEELKSSQSSLSAVVYKQESEIDKQRKKSVMNNAIVFGVPFKKSENLLQITTKILGNIGAVSCCDSVISVSRINASEKKSMPPIRIIFKDKKSKDLVFKLNKESNKIPSTLIDPSLKHTRNSSFITIRDELTPLSAELLNELRHAQEKLKLKYVWPGRGGVILVKKDTNTKPLEVRNRLDLDKLLKHVC